MEKLLSPQNASHYSALNIHEVLERVRSVVLAKCRGLMIQRDYDISLPALIGDKEQMIQAMLNIVRNAGRRCRAAAPSSCAPHCAPGDAGQAPHRLAVMVQINDNGPDSPELRTRFFIRWYRGRRRPRARADAGQDFISQHHGAIDWTANPGALFLPCCCLTLTVKPSCRRQFIAR